MSALADAIEAFYDPISIADIGSLVQSVGGSKRTEKS